MGFEIRKNEKHVKAEEFVKEMKKMHEEANCYKTRVWTDFR